MPTNNVGPLRINSRCLVINSSILSYQRHWNIVWVISYSYLKLWVENLNLKLIASLLVIYQCRGVHKASKTKIFLWLPLSSTVNPYLQFCHYNLIITSLPLLLLQFAYLQFCLYLGPELPSIMVYPQNLGCYIFLLAFIFLELFYVF